jgi:hypothetical protein
MKALRIVLAVAVVATLAAPASVQAASAKTYQVTGPVLAVDAGTITVQKGSDKWEIARDASTKITGELKVGAKVTIEYRMTATAVDVKSDTKPAKSSKK